jgi:hypothetical protein
MAEDEQLRLVVTLDDQASATADPRAGGRSLILIT